MKKILASPFLFLLSLSLTAQNNKVAREKDLVARMTLEEKLKLVVGTGMELPGTPSSNNGPVVGETMDKVPGAAGTTFPLPHLGIPTVVLADGPAGLRIHPVRSNDSSKTFYCTAFPVGTLLASTWDTALVKIVGTAMGSEVKEYGADILLAPALNIHRNPLGGRNFEYYSEDPVLSGNIAAAMVNGIESKGVGSSVKHFAANNQETNRTLVNSIVSERALREIYLRSFEIAVKKSQPWTVMSSYNKLNGTYTSQEYDLLTTILRKEWGFKGMVMTDWFGGEDAVAQMKAGNDLLMPGTAGQDSAIRAALKSGVLEVKVLDENAERILKIILESPAYKKYQFSNRPDLKAHAVIARSAAAEGMVLLKNEIETLPLDKGIHKIAVFGNTSYDFISGGTGSGDVNEAYTISLVDGLINAGLTINRDLKESYDKYIIDQKAKAPKKKFFFELPAPFPEMELDENMLLTRALEEDVAIITIGRNAGEFQDRKTTNDYYLSDAEKKLIKKVATAFHANNKKMVVILNVGGVIDVTQWQGDADAILLAWQGGQEAGNAVADILTGKVNPSGKLPTTFPASYTEEPTAKNFPGRNLSTIEKKGVGGLSSGFDSEVIYEEGIYVGYRYYNSFKVKPAYAFGFGLSYTKFDYQHLKLTAPDAKGNISVSIDITNTGNRPGREVVQLYVTAARGDLAKPSEELRGFAKTSLLLPGRKQTLHFYLNAKDLASYDTKRSSWIVANGTYLVKAATSSDNFRQTASFKLSREIVAEKCNSVLKPKVKIQELAR